SQSVDIWRAENSSERLAPIPQEWAENLRSHASRLRMEIKLAVDKKSINTILREEELRILSSLVRKIFMLRMRKVIDAALRGETLENMLEFEEEMYRAFQKLGRAYLGIVNEVSEMLNLSPKIKIDEKELVVMLKDTSAIVDKKGHVHGPFREGDIAIIPPDSAELLERGGYAKRLPNSK
ncbi:MAG: hypothetical protein QXQ33_04810, partial [Nitrososphaerota archaeon]